MALALGGGMQRGRCAMQRMMDACGILHEKTVKR